jgi:opacity protein-like surface antigen
MRVTKEVDGGLHDHVSVYGGVGCFGISVFHQLRRFCRSEASLVIEPGSIWNWFCVQKEIERTERNMIPKLIGAAILVVLMSASLAMAQERHLQEISVQGTGLYTKDSNGNMINQHSTDAGGFLLSYRYHFNSWLAGDASYGHARNTQQNLTPSGGFSVQANVHQVTGAVVVTAPHRIFRLDPFALAGVGALVFDPTGNEGGFVSGAQSQSKGAFVYGGGADYELTRHFTLRAEYRGFVYGRPGFGLAALHSGATAHTAQPSAGIVFRF